MAFPRLKIQQILNSTKVSISQWLLVQKKIHLDRDLQLMTYALGAILATLVVGLIGVCHYGKESVFIFNFLVGGFIVAQAFVGPAAISSGIAGGWEYLHSFQSCFL